jgi:hypothetical protein
MSHIEIMKFCQNHWSLISMDQLENRAGAWGEALQKAFGHKYKDDVNGFASWIRYSARYVFELDVDEFIVKFIFLYLG